MGVRVSSTWQERKQEDRYGERKWEIEMRKKKKKKGIEMGEREEIIIIITIIKKELFRWLWENSPIQ